MGIISVRAEQNLALGQSVGFLPALRVVCALSPEPEELQGISTCWLSCL